jgi:PAS domain S-box-containing protein
MRPSGPKKPTAKKKTDPLRKKAAGMLAKQKERLRELSALELNKLVHELGTHQIELEMQNEELRRAQAEIESSRRKYADLYDFSPVGYFTFDRNGSIREVNHTGAGMLGLEKRSLIAGPFQNFIEPAGRAAFRSHLDEVFRTQTLQTCEVDLRGKNGILFAAQLQSIVANIGEGTVDTCRTALSDITERKKAEQALRESEERLRLAHRAANIGAFEWNVQTGVNVWTPQLEAMYGLDRGEFGKTQPAWERLVHPEDRAAALGLVDQAFVTGDPIEGEWRAVRRDGSVHWIAARFQAFKDAAGKPLRLSGVNMDITQRKQAEELLRQSQEQFRTLADSIPNLAWWANADGYITWYNRRWYEYTGTTPEQMEGWGWQSVHDPKMLPKVLERWKASIATGLPFDMEFPLRGADGVFRSFLTRVQPLKDAAGLVIRWFGTNTDISALKMAEDALRESEERFRSYFELGLIGMAITSPTKGTIEVNEKICEILGYERSELLQLKWPELTHGDDLAADIAHFNRVMAGEIDGYTIEKRFIRKNGDVIDAIISVKCVRTSDGSVDYFVVLLQDITERKQAEESLRKAKDLGDALNRINKAVHSTFDIEEIMRRVIRDAAEAVGCDSAAISMRDMDSWVVRYVHGMHQEIVGSRMTDDDEPHAMLALKTGKPVAINDALRDERVNAEHMKKFGIRSVMVVPLIAGEQYLGAIFFNHHAAAVAFSEAQIDFADKLASTITLAIDNARLLEAWKRAEEKVRNLNEELKRSLFELEAVNIELETFSYSVSHDLRAPLRSIEGFTTAIIEDCAATLDETGRDYFTRIVAASRRMSQLIDAMLHMARLTRSEIREQVVNLSGLAEGIVSELRKGNPERQAEFLIAPDIKAHGDTGMLRIVLENLLDNAFKFTSRHRTAKIEFGSTDMDGKSVYFVRDDGAGFDMRFADKLFKPFKRLHTESEYPGIGLGLATAHRIISRHNGRIWAESEPEKGATFYFTL